MASTGDDVQTSLNPANQRHLPTPLTTEEREKSLQPLLTKDWKIVDEKDAIQKTFKFKNFNQAFGFMTRIAMASEKLDHHPDWSNVYNSVTILWTTHCSGGITVNDIKMATFCETIYGQSMGPAAKF